MFEYGDDGVLIQGKLRKEKVVYIIMEYVDGPLLFDICKQGGSMGEDIGFFFLK